MISSQALPCYHHHHHVCAIEGLRLSAKAGGWRCAASDRPTLTFPRLPNFLTTNLNRSQCAQPNHQQDDFIFDALFELSVQIETRFLLTTRLCDGVRIFFICAFHFLSLCRCLFLYLCKCLFLYLCMCLFLYMCVCLFCICACASFCICVCVFFVFVHVPLFAFVQVPLFVFVCVWKCDILLQFVRWAVTGWGQRGNAGQLLRGAKILQEASISREAKAQTRKQTG